MGDNHDDGFLKKELVRLIRQSGHGDGLCVVWVPRIDSTKEGEVIGNAIYIYSTSPHMALETLRHEFFDLIVSNAIKPYMNLVNAFCQSLERTPTRAKRRLLNPCCCCVNLQQMSTLHLERFCVSIQVPI